MDTRKDSTESPALAGRDDQGEAVTNKQPSVVPAADATDTTATTTPTDPIAQAYGASEFTIHPRRLEPVIDLSVHRSDTSQGDLDEEAIVLMQTIRETISNTNTLMGYLATKPGVFEPFENEVAMLDATTAYLISILAPSAAARATPTRELRRLPMREPEITATHESRPAEVAGTSREAPPQRAETYFEYRSSDRTYWLHLVGSRDRSSYPAGSCHEEQAAVPDRSEPFNVDESSATLEEYWNRMMASEGCSQEGDESGHEEKAEPELKAELEVDDSGLDGVGWLYEVD